MVATASREMTVTFPSDTEILITRVVDAPRALVWEAYSKPEHLRNWLGPRALEMVVCDMDFRVGGGYRWVQRAPDGSEHAFHGEYREIVPLERASQTFEYEAMPGHVSLETVTFTDVGEGQTLITNHSQFANREDRDGMAQSGMEHGMREGFERLDEVLASLK